MKIKLDENLSRHLQATLRELGHDVRTTADEALLGHPDAAVASAAAQEERMLFTLDVEFADVRRFPPGTHPGIVLFRPSAKGPLHVNSFVLVWVGGVDLALLAGCLVVVEPGRVRLRRPPRCTP